MEYIKKKILTLTWCLKRNTTEDIDIYTGVYPLRYIVDYLYGDNAKIYSIYPNGVNIDEYELTSKQIEDYSKSGLFVFNSLDVDRDYAVKMINENKIKKTYRLSIS